jgi:hypothetical protein
MAYDPTVPPSLIGQGIGGTEGLRWYAFMWVDPIAAVLEPGYISNAGDLGMRPGDSVSYKDTNRGEWDEYKLIVTEVDEFGAATLAFPEIPEEALPEVDTFDPADMTQYLAMYQGGRLSRLQVGLFAPNGATIASQAEAEEGTNNDKQMTPLRVFQAIMAYLVGRATKATPENADEVLVVDSDDGAPKRTPFSAFVSTTLSGIGAFVGSLTSKTTPVDADSILISDSEAGGVQKRLTLANLKTAVGTFVSAVLGFTSKTSPDDADIIGYVQASDSTGRKFTWANLKSALGFPSASVGVGVVKLLSGTVTSGAATLDIPLPSGYKSFSIRARLLPSAVSRLWCRVSANGTTFDSGSTDYQVTISSMRASSTTEIYSNSLGTSEIPLSNFSNIGNAASRGIVIRMEIDNYADASDVTMIGWRSTMRLDSSDGVAKSEGSAYRAALQATQAVRFLFSTGNIASGTYEVYGYV